MDDKVTGQFRVNDTEIDTIRDHLSVASDLIRNNADQSLVHAQDAEDLARSISYPLGIANSLRVQTAVFHRIGDYYSALNAADEALKLYEALGEAKLKSALLIRVGGIYGDLGDLPQGIKTVLKALEFFKKANDKKPQADMLCRIGIMHSMLGDSKLAIENYLQGIEIYHQLGNIREEAYAQNSCCVDYTILKEFDKARISGERSIRLFAEANDPFGIGVATSSLGEIFLAQKNLEKSIVYFEQAIILCRKSKADLISVEVVETKINLARAYHFSGEPKLALEHLNAVLTHAENQNLKPVMMKCHRILAQIGEEAGDLSAALSHLKKHVELKEQITSKAKERELHHLHILHKTSKAQAENESLKKLREKDRAHFQRLTQIKDDFLNNATHDIKNPLLIINTSTYLLKEKLSEADESIYKHIDQINTQSDRIRYLVEDILDLAKLESTLPNNIKKINLSEWLNDFEQRFRILAESKRISLLVETHQKDLICSINKERLEQAIDNILSNAFKYTQQGGQVQLRANKCGSELLIQVKDNGLGIPKESIPHLFDRFYRANNQARDFEVEGTGLGLSIAKLSIEQHGGKIHVDSTVNKGTVFSISLPQ